MGVINKVVLDGTTHTIAASALAICDTAAASSAKVATVSGNQAFTLIEGTTIQVQFKYANTATNPTLDINGTGAKSIFCFGTEPIANDPSASWQDGSIISFTYNGTGWVYSGYQVATGSGGGGVQRNANWTATTGVTSILNKPTEFNPTSHASSSSNYGVGNTGQYGHVKLSNAIASEAGVIDGIAATPVAVKNAKEYALNHSVPLTRTINDKPLSSDIQLDYTDVGAPSLAAVPQISAVTSSGVNIADVTVNGNTTHLYAPAGGGGMVQVDWNATSGINSILNKPNLATVATTGNYNDLNGQPEIPSIAVSTYLDEGTKIASITINNITKDLYAPAGGGGSSQQNADWAADTGVTSILHKPNLAAIATSGNYGDLNNTPQFATIATTGDYNDLTNKPNIPSAQINVDWEAESGVESILNKPTAFNPTNHASSESDYGVADYYNYGHVKLTDQLYGTESIEDGVAATPCAVSKIFDSIYATANYSSGAYLGSITINGNATDFFSPSGAAPIILSALGSLDDDELLHISANFTNGIPVKIRQNVAGSVDEEHIDYLDLIDVASNNGDGVPSYLTFTGTTSTQIHRIYYDNTASSLAKWAFSYTQIPAVPTATAAVSSGDRLLVQTVISAASSTSDGPVLDLPNTYEIKTTSIEFGNSTTQFLANDGQWRTPAEGSAGGTANYTNGILEIVFYNE